MKTITINIRVSKAEKEMLREAAKNFGLSLSAYLRLAALTEVQRLYLGRKP